MPATVCLWSTVGYDGNEIAIAGDVVMSIWLRTNEAEETVGAVESTARFAGEVAMDRFAWRWVLLSLHNALQGAMVIAVRDSAGVNVLPKNLAREWLATYEAGGTLPQERLDSFLNLYTKLKKKEIARQLGAARFVPKGLQSESMKRLNCLRNTFVHFVPASLSLELTGLPAMCLDSVDVLEYALFGYRSLQWSSDHHPRRLLDGMSNIRARMKELSVAYAEGAETQGDHDRPDADVSE